VIRDLTRPEIETPEFWRLLRLAAEVDEVGLLAIRDRELPRLTVVGALAGDVVVGFAAYAVEADGPVGLEYIATAESQRGRGLGTSLVRELRRRHPEADLRAQTDDDAIAFYRRIGFTDAPAPPDPRWPDRPRYDCVLPAGLR